VLDREYMPVFLNESMRQFMGVTDGDICIDEQECKKVAREFWERIFSDKRSKSKNGFNSDSLRKCLNEMIQSRFCEMRSSKNRRKNFKLDVTEVEETGDMILTFTEVTRIMRERRKYERRSYTDTLTGLINRFRFNQVLLEKLFDARQRGEDLSIMVLDLDLFKQINDKFGHLEGDRVLVEFAERLKDAIKPPGIVARWGGEEFVVLLPNVGAKGAMEKAEELRRLIESKPFGEKSHAITCSIGVACLSQRMETPSSLFEKADRALYRAKELGRNRVELAEETEFQDRFFPESDGESEPGS